MITKLNNVGLWVKNQDEAKKFYVEKLGFALHKDDSTTVPGYRWLTVAPQQQTDVEMVLGLAVEPDQKAMVGKQGTWVLNSDDIHDDYKRLTSLGVKCHYEPKVNPWGTDFVFEDLYGNTYDLVQSPAR